jgi:phage tail sheath protein FI
MADIYLHGIETQEIDAIPNPVQTIDTGIIALIGTAPDANATLWPLNKIVPIYGSNGAVQGLGAAGTLKDAIEGIFDQAGRVSQTILVIRVTEGADIWATMSNIIGAENAFTGMYALLTAKSEHNLVPKLLIAPGFTSQRPADGIASIAKDTNGVGYTSAPTVTIGAPAAGGLQATAVATIDSETGELDEIIITDFGRGYASAPTVTLSGGGATTQATATATIGTVANPVTAKLLTLARRFRAGVIKDSTATNAAAAVADRLDFDTERMLIVEPMVKVFRDAEVVSEPGSARIAGLQAYVDYTEGFWFSPSNHVVQGVIGVSRPVGHSISDPSAESQYLNKNGIAVICRAPSGGFKLWGSRVPSSGTMKFWSVRRAHDTIIDSIELACEPYIDKPFSLQVITDIAETVNSALRRWARLGATLGGRVWLDPVLNTKETWANGQLFIHYDAEGPAPIEHITFMFSRNTGYYEVLAQNAVKEIERIAGTAIPA